MNNMKIIQITASSAPSSDMEDIVYGLADDGTLWYWGREIIPDQKRNIGEPFKWKHGWKQMIDEIN